MNRTLSMLALAILSGGVIAAPGDQDAAREQREVEQRIQGERAEKQRALAEAERKLAEAAREVAELSQSMSRHSFVIADGDFDLGVRPVLGVTLSSQRTRIERDGTHVVDEDSAGQGPRISRVNPGSGAEKAGLQRDDRIVSVDGVSVISESGGVPIGLISEALSDRKPGDTVVVELLRDGQRLAKQVELTASSVTSDENVFRFHVDDDMAPLVIENFGPGNHELQELKSLAPLLRSGGAQAFIFGRGQRWADMELVELSEGLGDYFGADSGLLVVRAPSDESLGFEDGDVIRSIGGREPDSVGHALRILRSYEAGEQLSVEILRKRKRRKIDITLPE